jgi:hypothetical protein
MLAGNKQIDRERCHAHRGTSVQRRRSPGIAGTVRRWFDTGKTQPTTFRYSLFGTATVLRVDFELEAEAQAFARAFGGIGLGQSF